MKLFNAFNELIVKKLFGDFWVPTTIKPAPRVEHPTFDLLKQAYAWERNKCGYVAQMLGNKYVTKRNKTLPKPNYFDTEGILQVKIKPANLQANSTESQTFEYPVPQLNTIMKKVEESLNIDRPIVVGVMSGVNHTDNGVVFTLVPKDISPEHYVLIFGQDGDKFFFWDPDITSSNIDLRGLATKNGAMVKPENWGPGFGVFFYRHDKTAGIGTAFSDADLADIDVAGNHNKVPTRHRYQAYYLRNGLSFDKEKVKEKLRYDQDLEVGLPGK
jgi:hypothetical protein